MDDRDGQPAHPDEPQVPPALAAGLARLDRAHRPAWPDRDPVLAAAEQPPRRHWRAAGLSVGLTAAAAGLAAGVFVWVGGGGTQSGPSVPPAGPSSPVTMLDAYRLRLMLDAGRTPAPAWDANADGRVGAADVETLAAQAVRLAEASS